jgi:acyl carrier protein
MNEQELAAEIMDALLSVAPEVDPATVDSGVAFRDQFDMDSVDFLNFVLTLEQKAGVKIPEADYPKLSTLQGCIAYLQARPHPR